ncbi:MAG TPA: prepilin-type N-terminal cleavage/methylation domain-containing protein [Spongiibacteraceae bacterium]|jgi:prepilin-type N-terminal cleavage/methylation domain-containing protein
MRDEQSFSTTQHGFSLIELIVVICIVVLVIYAGLPHFTDTLKQAHEMAVKLGARALQDGVMRAQAIQMLDGVSGSTYNLPRFGDGTLDLSPGGFPAGTSRKPGDRLSTQNCVEIWTAVLDPNPEDKTGSIAGNYHAAIDASGKNAVCVYSYVHGGKMSIRYDPSTGKVSADAQFKDSVFSD